jgi:hypothetical protein
MRDARWRLARACRWRRDIWGYIYPLGGSKLLSQNSQNSQILDMGIVDKACQCQGPTRPESQSYHLQLNVGKTQAQISRPRYKATRCAFACPFPLSYTKTPRPLIVRNTTMWLNRGCREDAGWCCKEMLLTAFAGNARGFLPASHSSMTAGNACEQCAEFRKREGCRNVPALPIVPPPETGLRYQAAEPRPSMLVTRNPSCYLEAIAES